MSARSLARAWLLGLGWVSGACLAPGCTLQPLPDEASRVAVNSCVAEADCGESGVCLRGSCHASAGAVSSSPLSELVFELSAPEVSGAGVSAGQRFFLPDVPSLSALQAIDAQSSTYNLALPSMSQVDLSVIAQAKSPASVTNCNWVVAADGSLAVQATLLPSDGAMRGLPTLSFSEGVVDPNAAKLGVKFPQVSPGTYDLYLEPLDTTCPIPPTLLRNNVIGAQPVTIPVSLPAPSTLKGTIKAVGVDLTGWHVDVVDSLSGRRLSTVATVTAPDALGVSVFGVPGFAGLEYYPPPPSKPGAPNGSYAIRLAPPAGAVAPIFAFDGATVDPFHPGDAPLTLSNFSIVRVTVHARLEQSDQARGQLGHVLVQSRALRGAPSGVPSSFAVETDTDLDGSFSVTLLPGSYDVVASARGDASFAIQHDSWDIAPLPAEQGGRVVQLGGKPSLQLRVAAPLGASPIALGEVTATSSWAAAGAFDAVLVRTVVGSRGGSWLTDANGAATLQLDPGTYDLTVRPSPSAGVPWVVGPSTSVPSTEPLALRASLPVEVRGAVSDRPLGDAAGRPLAGGALRVYGRVGADGGRFLLLGETRLDQQGSYRVLLPSRF